MSFVRSSGQSNALTSGFGSARPGGLDDDVVGLGFAGEQRRHSGSEVVRHRAADAAVGELDDRVLRTGFVGAAREQVAVDSDIAELVDDQRQPPSAGMAKDVADQRRLARAEKAGDDGDGGLGQHRESYRRRRERAAACAATTPLRKVSGRSRQGTIPSVEAAYFSAAVDDILDMVADVEIADDIGPFAWRGERHGARSLADGEALDRPERDRRIGEARGERIVKRRADDILSGLAGHTNQQRGGGRIPRGGAHARG